MTVYAFAGNEFGSKLRIILVEGENNMAIVINRYHFQLHVITTKQLNKIYFFKSSQVRYRQVWVGTETPKRYQGLSS